jgi:hypothetical protein
MVIAFSSQARIATSSTGSIIRDFAGTPFAPSTAANLAEQREWQR